MCVLESTLLQAAYFRRVNLSAQGFYKIPSICEFDFAMDTKNNADRGLPFNYFTQASCFSRVSYSGDFFCVESSTIKEGGRKTV